MKDLYLRDFTCAIRRALFEVYSSLGPGLLESVYQEALAEEFTYRGIPYEQEKEIIIELKSVKEIADIHRAQVINYLKLTDKKLGLLANFNSYPQLTVERLIN